MNDFQLHSGERQVGTRLHAIRPDHLARYNLVAENLDRLYKGTSSSISGLDCFCGNGYGTYLISTELGCSVHGIDASEDAINQANHHYKTPATSFEANYFPFPLQPNTYDFVCSIESIEHVEDSAELINTLQGSLKSGGHMFASVPNADVLSLEKNPNKFHHRHFSYMDFLKYANVGNGMKLETLYGQDTYLMNNGRVSGYLPDRMMEMRHRHARGQFLLFLLRKM